MGGPIGSGQGTGGFWALRTAALPGGRWELVGLLSEDHPDGSVVGPGPQVEEFPGAAQLLTLGLDDSGRVSLRLSPWVAPEAPPLWFVEMDASTPTRLMHSLVAFDTVHLADGTIVSNAAFFTMAVRSKQQVGAVRWDITTGEIDQIYVSPEQRDRQIARKLIVSAGAFSVHRGWSGKIHVGGRRSDAVEEMLVGRLPHRVLPRTERTVIIDPLTGEIAE